MEALFVDSDIILDLLARRYPFHKSADELFTYADAGKITCNISSLCFSNVHYVLTKGVGKSSSRKILTRFKALVNVLSVNDKIIDLALASDFTDLEDAIQYYTAIERQCELLLTRNLKDYRESQIPVMTAESYLQIHRNKLT